MGLPEGPPASVRAAMAMSRGENMACPFATVTASFYHQVTAYPSIAAVHDLSGPTPRELTYFQLALRAQALASKLRRLGVQPHQRIPLVVKRSLEMIVGIWAILSCGAQYIPLDGGVVPDSTIRHVVEQSEQDLVICLHATELRVRKLCPISTLVCVEDAISMVDDGDDIAPEKWLDLASSNMGCYVIYTSGKPKV